MVKPHLVEKYNLDLMYWLSQMHTGRQRQTHKVTTYQFLLDVGGQQKNQ